MAQYMGPLIRSGAMWSCERKTDIKPRGKLWSFVLRWLGLDRQNPSASLVFRSEVLRQGKPRY